MGGLESGSDMIRLLLSSNHCICNVDDRPEGFYHLGCFGLQVQKISTQSDLGCREICFLPNKKVRGRIQLGLWLPFSLILLALWSLMGWLHLQAGNR